MKNPDNRFNVDKLFILGAGTTYSLSETTRMSFKEAPLDNNFCKKILRLDTKSPKWVSGSVEYFRKEWKDNSDLEGFGLEQAIITQLSHLEFIDAIHKRRRTNSVTKESYLLHLTHLICYVLSRVRSSKNDLISAFTDKFFSKDTSNRIVTFNYDKLLDEKLSEIFDWHELYFSEIKKKRSDNSNYNSSHPILLKLHGSMNWRCVEDDYNKIINADSDKTRIDKIWIENTNRPSPSDDDYPLIIPPLPSKPITSIELFEYLWTKAYEYLYEAREFIIAGYSLPETDTLANVMFRSFKNKNLKRIVIIDPNASILEKWKTLLRRRGVGSAELVYYEDFSNYIERNC